MNQEKKQKLPTDLKFLGIAFFLIFIGYSGVRQYVAPFFSELGLRNIGLESLLLVYGAFLFASPSAGVFISKMGAKFAMILSAGIYSLFIFSLASGSIPTVYISSILLGFGAALLWNGRSAFVIRRVESKTYGRTFGFLETLKSLGSALSPMLVGLVAINYSFPFAFMLFALSPLLGMFMLMRVSDIRAETPSTYSEFIRAFKGITILRLSIFWFTMNFIFGLAIGVIPLSVQTEFGLVYVGIIQSVVYALSIGLFYYAGRLSDKMGRTKAISLFYFMLILALGSLYISGKVFLLIGIVLSTLAMTLGRPSEGGLIGEVAPKKHLETTNSFFLFMQNLGTVSALALSRLFSQDLNLIYLLSLGVIILSALNVIPLLMRGLGYIREKVALELERS